MVTSPLEALTEKCEATSVWFAMMLRAITSVMLKVRSLLLPASMSVAITVATGWPAGSSSSTVMEYVAAEAMRGCKGEWVRRLKDEGLGMFSRAMVSAIHTIVNSYGLINVILNPVHTYT